VYRQHPFNRALRWYALALCRLPTSSWFSLISWIYGRCESGGRTLVALLSWPFRQSYTRFKYYCRLLTLPGGKAWRFCAAFAHTKTLHLRDYASRFQMVSWRRTTQSDATPTVENRPQRPRRMRVFAELLTSLHLTRGCLYKGINILLAAFEPIAPHKSFDRKRRYSYWAAGAKVHAWDNLSR